MKTKVICESWDPESGIAKVIIKNNYGEFLGVAKLHPDDEQYKSSFAGLELATAKAFRKYYEFRAKEDLRKSKEYENLLATLETEFNANYQVRYYLKGKIKSYQNQCIFWMAKADYSTAIWELNEKTRRLRLDKFYKRKESKNLVEAANDRLRKAMEKYYSENTGLDKKD